MVENATGAEPNRERVAVAAGRADGGGSCLDQGGRQTWKSLRPNGANYFHNGSFVVRLGHGRVTKTTFPLLHKKWKEKL